MDTEIGSGLLIIGVTSTVLFNDGVSTTELILLNLGDGYDFTLPVSEEQALVIANHASATGGIEADRIEEVPVVAPEAAAFAKNIGLVDNVKEVSFGEVRTSEEAEATPQF